MLPDNPQLLIIAGPNGAGKSTFSKDIARAGAFIFDADKEIARLEKQFPDLPTESISFALQQYFLDCVDHAIKNREDLVIETNFRDAALMDTVARFKGNGYATDLVYLGLSGIKQSMARVKQRVRKGGHFVDKFSIQHNYTEGLQNLIYFSGHFDDLEIIDASGSQLQLDTIMSIQKKQVVYQDPHPPKWAKDCLRQISNQLHLKTQNPADDNKRGRGPRR